MSEDLAKFLNMVLSGLGLIALVYVIVKIFKLDRFVPPIIPGFGGDEEKNQPQTLTQPIQRQMVQEQTEIPSTNQTYGSYYYTDLYQNLPNVPQIPEPSVSHNKAGNKTQIEDLPMITSEYNQNIEKDEVEPFFDVETEIRPIKQPQPQTIKPMIVAPRRNTKNEEKWQISRDEEGNLIGISVERDVKEFADE
jgi:hypothetical protein